MNKRQMHAETERILQRINTPCSSKMLVQSLTIGVQQMVEIAKALSVNAQILIMDEPTSSLSQKETEQLFKVIQELKAQGVSIIYISHRMGEVKEVADRVTVLRDGCVSGHLRREEISHANMIRLMVGRDIETFFRTSRKVSNKPVLEVKDLEVPGQRGKKVNFVIHAGEIVVLAGLVGAGRTELVRTIFGIDQPLGGEILLNGKPITINTPADAIEAGIGLVPEDRKRQGLIVNMAVDHNVTLAGLRWWHNRFKMMLFDKLGSVAEEMTRLLGVRMTGIHQIAESLSGGNQQKVVIAKWLALKPKVLLLDEPTRGIDVVAKGEIYKLMEELSSQGVALLVISSEMQEVLGIADRILVMHEGQITGELQDRTGFIEETVVTLATGGF
jgi:ribose transport system ATP-binding protein